ncbi:LacI family DNA-binding transcriptional regulator [Actinoplanes aureus]|uniref:LacI family DNA-binding transcriptional regulator n=1 Tax=Actinoplanes aureus TaxID=2792083 RepID=A0A931CBF1_9ACTN|nr:LacI family DNA-binding transcriptional regulator [Actinoplanes aureus]MBG0566979.1 LacI family DNA-binding transcriptional regulator [Actinoplanes aureus]
MGDTGSKRTRQDRRPGGNDVARLAGVSQKTVSRVFNGESNVSADTRDRVLAAAQTLGYRPNGAARALLTGRTHRLGVVALGTSHFGPSSLLVALERAARTINYALSIANSFEDDPSGLAEAVDNLLAQGVDAVILSEPVDDGDEPLVVDVPVLTLGAAPVVHAPTVLSVRAAEGGDAAAEVTRHLLELGHRTVHHIAGPQRWWAARERLQNWQDTLIAAGAEVPQAVEGDWTAARGYAAGKALARDPGVTAIFAANDEMAIGVIHALHEAGRSVPGDVSVVGFDDIPVAAHVWPPLTTVSSDNAELATVGLTYLVDFLNNPDSPPAPPPKHVHNLVVRASTSRPPTAGEEAHRA